MIEVYRNLNKPGFFSIKGSDGKVFDYATCIKLSACRLHINESGRRRVIRNRRKGVHATVKASAFEIGDFSVDGLEELYFDPYFTLGFMSLKTGDVISVAEVIICKNNRCYVASSAHLNK